MERKKREEKVRTNLLACGADWRIVLVCYDADFVHQADLLLIVARERLAGGVDVGEETQDGLSGNGLRRCGGGCCRHGCLLLHRVELATKELVRRLTIEKERFTSALSGDGYQD